MGPRRIEAGPGDGSEPPCGVGHGHGHGIGNGSGKGIRGMPVEVQIPQIFRRHTNGSLTVRATGGTLREVLADLDRAYPGLRGQLLTPDGELHRFLNVYVNQEDVRFLQGQETRLADGDLVTILPAVAGGARPWLPSVAGGALVWRRGRRRMGRV